MRIVWTRLVALVALVAAVLLDVAVVALDWTGHHDAAVDGVVLGVVPLLILTIAAHMSEGRPS